MPTPPPEQYRGYVPVYTYINLHGFSDVPKGGGARGPWPLPELRRPLRPRDCFFFVKHWMKHLLLRRKIDKIDFKVSFMCPWLPEGLLMTQWAPAVIREPPGFLDPGRLGPPLVAGGPGRMGPLSPGGP